jgi:hypothetical protein
LAENQKRSEHQKAFGANAATPGHRLFTSSDDCGAFYLTLYTIRSSSDLVYDYAHFGAMPVAFLVSILAPYD